MIGYASVPIDLDREEARELARQELSQPGYQRDASWPSRVLEWIIEQFNRLIEGAAERIPGGLAVILIMAAVVAVAVLVVLRTGPLARRQATRDPIFTGHRRTADEYRAAAADAARAEDWTTAVLERFRAVVAHLEEREVIDAQSGRTADEVARTAGHRLADIAAGLANGAVVFDRVLYGGRTAVRDDDATMRDLDNAVRESRPRAATGDGPSLAVPR